MGVLIPKKNKKKIKMRKLIPATIIASTLLVGCGGNKEETFYEEWKKSQESYIRNVENNTDFRRMFHRLDQGNIQGKKANLDNHTPDIFTHDYISRICFETVPTMFSDVLDRRTQWQEVIMGDTLKNILNKGDRERMRKHYADAVKLALYMDIEAESLNKACNKYF